MPVAIALYLLAGAFFVGGPLAGKLTYDAAQREAARSLAARDRRALIEALSQEMELEELRRRARAVGVDDQAVVNGYLALRDGRMSLDQVIAALPPNVR